MRKKPGNSGKRTKRLSIADVYNAAGRQGASVRPDGCGGYEVLAPYNRRWTYIEAGCLVLPLNEFEDDEVQLELRRALDVVTSGHEPFPG